MCFVQITDELTAAKRRVFLLEKELQEARERLKEVAVIKSRLLNLRQEVQVRQGERERKRERERGGGGGGGGREREGERSNYHASTYNKVNIGTTVLSILSQNNDRVLCFAIY